MTATLEGRAILITGGGRGYGERAAHALAAEGAHICIADVNPDRVDNVEETIIEAGGQAVSVQGDVSNKFQAAHMIETTREAFGGLHALVINAHVSPKADILKMDEWNWRRSLEVNVTGAFFTAQFAARVMAEETGGDIVFLLRDGPSTAFRTAQGALQGLAHGMQGELTGTGVRIHLLDVNASQDFEADLIKSVTSGIMSNS